MPTVIRGRQIDRLASYVGNTREGQVMDIGWNVTTRTFELREGCDGYYSISMTPEELVELGTELVKTGSEVL